MDTIQVSLEVFANYLGINSSELSTTLTVEKEGAKVPKPQSDIDSFLSSKLTEKVTIAKSKGKEEGQGWAKKETLTEVENLLSESFGITEGTWKEKLAKIKDSKADKVLKSDITEEQIKSSPIYQNSLKLVKDELISEREAHQATKKGFKVKEIGTVADRKALKVLRDEKNKFQIPDGKAESWEKIYLDKIKNSGFQISIDDNENIVLLDKNGQPAEDSNFIPISFDAYALNIGKELFPTAAANPKGTPPTTASNNPASGSVTVPTFANAEEVHKYLDSSIADPKISTEMMSAAKDQLANFK